MADVGHSLGIDVLAGEKQIGASAKVHVLLYLNGDLLLAERCVVFLKTRVHNHMVWQQGKHPEMGQNNRFIKELGTVLFSRTFHAPMPIDNRRKPPLSRRDNQIGSDRA